MKMLFFKISMCFVGVAICALLVHLENTRYRKAIDERNFDTFVICIEDHSPNHCHDLIYGRK